MRAARLIVTSTLLLGGALASTQARAASSCANAARPNAVNPCPPPSNLNSITALPDGGKSYNYMMPNGRIASQLLPPAGFHPVNATATQLAEYSLPPRPSDPQKLKKWQTLMKDVWFATPGKYMYPTRAGHPNEAPAPPASPHATPAAPATAPIQEYLNIQQGGYEAKGTYSSDEAGYYEPTPGSSSCGSNVGVATWSGLGNQDSGFGQTGTYSIPADGSYGSGPDQGFFQVWNGTSMLQSGLLFTPAPGDYVVGATAYNPSNSLMSGSLTDGTTGQSMAWAATVPTPGPTSAESLVEEPGYPGQYDLENFETIPFEISEANGDSLDQIGSTVGFNIDDGSQDQTYLGPLGYGGSFAITQTHCS